MHAAARSVAALGAALLFPALLVATPAPASRILFIGNSFTYAQGSPVRFYQSGSVTDLNSEGQGGVPALFKAFSREAQLHYDVSLETHPGVSLDWHLQHKRALIGERPWDWVVMQEFSTLDEHHPGDATRFVASVHQWSERLRARNASVQIRLLETWPRADQTYLPQGHWHDQPIEAMAQALHAAYQQAGTVPGIGGVIPVGDAWLRAMHEQIADPNPYDGIAAGQMDLWTYDGYHGSLYGYYLDALVVFGAITARDPRTLARNECAGFELGLSAAQIEALQSVAYEQLHAEHLLPDSPAPAPSDAAPQRCSTGL